MIGDLIEKKKLVKILIQQEPKRYITGYITEFDKEAGLIKLSDTMGNEKCIFPLTSVHRIDVSED